MHPAVNDKERLTRKDVGLFSLFKRKAPQPSAPQPSAPQLALPAADTDAQRQRHDIARATALKIDAIESAMAFDIFNTPEPAWGSTPARSGTDHAHELSAPDLESADFPADAPDLALAPQAAPVVEEVAILFANGQTGVAQQMLQDNLASAGGQNERTLWWMLFDLFQVTGQQESFDDLSIDYASKFESSPPAWVSHAPLASATAAFAGVTPTLTLTGLLDAASAQPLERWQQLAAEHPVLRLDLGGISALDAPGCALLLHSLRSLQQHELIVVAADDLVAKVRATIRVGRREDTEAPWLLLLELLQLLKLEKAFEEASMDYCVTFEVSPPAFIAPGKVATAARQDSVTAADRFLLPVVIEGNTDALIAAINAYAAPTIVFDCSRLARIDFGAAGRLLVCLHGLTREGRKIELRDVNHLVAALLRLLAFSDIAKIFPHKY